MDLVWLVGLDLARSVRFGSVGLVPNRTKIGSRGSNKKTVKSKKNSSNFVKIRNALKKKCLNSHNFAQTIYKRASKSDISEIYEYILYIKSSKRNLT